MAANPRQQAAVITGAASGIGCALAQALAAQGYALALADIDANALEAARAALAGQGATVIAIPTDVSDAAQIEHLCEESFRRLGRVDLLVNNAGILATGRCWELEPEVFERVLRVNLWSVLHALRNFVPRMAEQGSGHIVNVASMAGLAVGPWLAPYTLSKQGVVALSEGLLLELQAAGIPLGVSVVCPGPVATGIAAGLGGTAQQEVDQMNGALRNGIAAGMTPDAVAQRILDGVSAGQFWILPHEQAAQAALVRAQGIAAGKAPAFAL
ncbi:MULTISPECIES: SDR family NAD(P)-dependent oxidoreductase [Cupriavidus]|uniref:Short-chain dehydrogenase/reductase SDR:Glucose/ribitol dehydrogenase n=1 Tax=Cupriavidus pinatubonensis (strain JMP 134 / LMG 1197) TaxID=264198 RepID=Q471M9_CUPPJ|nr:MULTISPECIES: SDR family NAD(P)-dependent oxidoreductase [Cupriavidus]TPQ39181.1 KR domain-containing protein [Cupriavidus pinatubonensis]